MSLGNEVLYFGVYDNGKVYFFSFYGDFNCIWLVVDDCSFFESSGV